MNHGPGVSFRRWKSGTDPVMTLGNESDPYARTLGVVIQYGATTIDVDEVTEDTLRAMASRTSDANGVRQLWPLGSITYHIGRVQCIVVDGEVHQVNIFTVEVDDGVSLSTDLSGGFVQWPISDADAELLFGPPTRRWSLSRSLRLEQSRVE